MKIEQLYTGCLAEAAYYIESNGEAAIIDPLRETEPYLELLEQEGSKLKYIFETHFHADFVSGHIDLAKATGATIVYGPNAEAQYDIHVAQDNEDFKLGNVTIRTLHTPGHTMESTTWLLIDEDGVEHSIYSGDTLFIGDVGRPDLAQKKGVLTTEDLAGYLYDSLRTKIMTLPDSIIVYPGHGAGSACGKNLGTETWDTLGHQKETNYALRADMTKQEFIDEVTHGILPPPQYFPKNAAMNKAGYDSIDSVLSKGMQALDPTAVELEMQGDALLLDTREPAVFGKKFIKGAMNIGLNGNFAMWVGALIQDLQQRIVLITDPGKEKEAVTRLARVGYDNAVGYLSGGVDAWEAAGKPVDSIPEVDAEWVASNWNGIKGNVVDMRNPTEYASQHLEGVDNIPLDYISERFTELNPDNEYYLHCRSGYRSMVAASILRSKGFNKLTNVAGGFNELSKTELPVTDYVCPTTL